MVLIIWKGLCTFSIKSMERAISGGRHIIAYHYPCPDGIFAALAATLHFRQKGTHDRVQYAPNRVYAPCTVESLQLTVSANLPSGSKFGQEKRAVWFEGAFQDVGGASVAQLLSAMALKPLALQMYACSCCNAWPTPLAPPISAFPFSLLTITTVGGENTK